MEFAGRHRDVNCIRGQGLLNQGEALLLGIVVGKEDKP